MIDAGLTNGLVAMWEIGIDWYRHPNLTCSSSMASIKERNKYWNVTSSWHRRGPSNWVTRGISSWRTHGRNCWDTRSGSDDAKLDKSLRKVREWLFSCQMLSLKYRSDRDHGQTLQNNWHEFQTSQQKLIPVLPTHPPKHEGHVQEANNTSKMWRTKPRIWKLRF